MKIELLKLLLVSEIAESVVSATCPHLQTGLLIGSIWNPAVLASGFNRDPGCKSPFLPEPLASASRTLIFMRGKFPHAGSGQGTVTF